MKSTSLSINKPIAVLRIPTEILSTIFEILAFSKPEVDETSASSDLYDYQPWLAVSQVCRFWRDAALGYSPMWGCIYSQIDVRLVELCLERAMSTRSRSPKPNPPTLNLLLHQSDGLKELYLEDCTNEWLSVLTQRQFPLIETLELDASERIFKFTNPAQAKLAPLGTGTAPPLRHLIFTDFEVDLTDPQFSNLRTSNLRWPELTLLDPPLAMTILREWSI